MFRGTPLDYGHRALRAHVGALSFVVLPGKEQAVLVECLGFFVRQFVSVHAFLCGFQYIRRSVLRVGQTVAPFLLKIVRLLI